MRREYGWKIIFMSNEGGIVNSSKSGLTFKKESTAYESLGRAVASATLSGNTVVFAKITMVDIED